MTFVGLGCLGATYVSGLIMLSRNPAVAAQIVTLSQVVVIAVGTLVTAYIGAQGYVDGQSAKQQPVAPPVQ
jgi:hypothetical protein